MKKCTVLVKLDFLCLTILLLISIVGCKNNSNSNSTSSDLPKRIGDFPLELNWKKDLYGELEAMDLQSGVLVTGVVNDKEAVIQAFDITTGSRLWKREISGNGIGINIKIADKSVYVVFSPRLVAMDLMTGDLTFETDIQASDIDEIAGISKDHIFIFRVSEGVYAYNRLTGEMSWRTILGRGNVNVIPDVTHDLVYIIHGEYLDAVYEEDGSVAWQQEIGFHGQVGYYEGLVYYSNNKAKDGLENHLQALSLSTKKQLWNSDLNEEIKCINTTSDNLIVITNQALVNFDRLSGEKIWGYYISQDVYCPPTILRDVVYIKDGFDNQISAYDRENGDLLGSLDFEDSTGIGYKIPKDNLITSVEPFPVLVFYLKNSVYVYK
jgi:outer membrane protein assembly factor BamB